ncbi:heat shock 70 kDa protein 12A-like [Mya arenaria]|uniref:heat shock 70 kDa protein 12A-like n=1 Tax=Mya arenaria TaxID=6604 RepID=UPI0022E5543A|nr:heat shock 70 kDa protein 12A-like [Mya arenaria]
MLHFKAPTCVLIEPDGDTFSAFGYDAESKYNSLVKAEEHDKWFFFRRLDETVQYERSGSKGSLSSFKTGNKVVVDDAGELSISGGTVDIAVQEVAENGSMKNIYKASGGDWGGAKVDEAFVSVQGDKFKVNMSVVTFLFKTQVDAIVQHVSNLIEQSTIGGIEAIVSVGGFSKCPLLQKAIKLKFDGHKVIVPNDPDLAVLKGAVIFGHKPELINQRVSKYTYGVDMRTTFNDNVHKEAYKVIGEDEAVRCIKCFDKHIIAGQSFSFREAQVEKCYTAPTSSQTSVSISILYTLDPNPMYTTDQGCHLADTLNVAIGGSGLGRAVKVRMIYGGTEIEVEATEVATGNVQRMKTDFLS